MLARSADDCRFGCAGRLCQRPLEREARAPALLGLTLGDNSFFFACRPTDILSRLRSRSDGRMDLVTWRQKRRPRWPCLPLARSVNSLLFGHSLTQPASQSLRQRAGQRGGRQVDHPRMCGPFVCSRHTRAKSGLTEQSLPVFLSF